MRQVQRFVLFLFASALLMRASPLDAQVTTATLVGQLRDTSGAVIPGATVVATHEGTGVSREAVTDANGEFVLAVTSQHVVRETYSCVWYRPRNTSDQPPRLLRARGLTSPRRCPMSRHRCRYLGNMAVRVWKTRAGASCPRVRQ
jgi:hypothetical protein